ncbi:AraC family ligand binding domain-containing protein [Streptomyces sp. NPDC092307]|uniref:AraC family ligand binding domain-containing protein n=1 Tax=Streptomyces sp. NPDC092307 TaxID=3366013 RepID=UPI00380D313E
MDKPVPVEPVFLAPPSADPVEDARVRVVWTLEHPGRDLDAKVVRLGAGAVTGEGGGTTVGLLLVVVAGSGEVRTPGRTVALAPGSAAWLPTGTPHSVRAGDNGLTYTQAHRRRPPLDIAPRLGSDAGEPACLLHLVCDACGRLAAERDARYCTRCGALLGDDGNPVAH